MAAIRESLSMDRQVFARFNRHIVHHAGAPAPRSQAPFGGA